MRVPSLRFVENRQMRADPSPMNCIRSERGRGPSSSANMIAETAQEPIGPLQLAARGIPQEALRVSELQHSSVHNPKIASRCVYSSAVSVASFCRKVSTSSHKCVLCFSKKDRCRRVKSRHYSHTVPHSGFGEESFHFLSNVEHLHFLCSLDRDRFCLDSHSGVPPRR